MNDGKLECAVAGVCSGCDWILRPYGDQLADKAAALRKLWAERGLPPSGLEALAVRAVAPGGLRDRADLVFRRDAAGTRLGLYELGKRELLALPDCPAMSPALRAWFAEFKADPPPIDIGSVRLRVSPSGVRGAWLDFSNLDVKKLLEEGKWLDRLLSRAIVEVGQRKKRLVRKEKGLGLGDPQLEPWLSTFVGGKAVPLYSVIGAFTQTGTEANRAIIEELAASLPEGVSGRWLELGSGIGNLTLPLAAAGADVVAIELDELALEGLARSAAEAALSQKITVMRMSFQQPSDGLRAALVGVSGIVADPPRSGLLRFPEILADIPAGERPRHFVYVSCHGDSFSEDAARLHAIGYRLVRISGVDQFPQTSHCEYVARFEQLVE